MSSSCFTASRGVAGELKETAQLMGLASVIGEQLLSKEERTVVWRTWGSAVGMLPIGGTAIWGNATWAPDDIAANLTTGRSLGCVLAHRHAFLLQQLM
jgi:hypothetical protein